MSKETVYNSLTALELKIMSILKLDDSGKIHKFFKSEVKRLNSDIDNIEMNKQSAEVKQKNDLSQIDYKIEDAEEELAESYTAVKIEDIGSNDANQSFSVRYWGNIDAKESRLKTLKESREAVVKDYEETLKNRNEKIAKIKERIAAIS